MYIAYLWVDNWLKLMSACAEQMQLLPAAIEGNGTAAIERDKAYAAYSAQLEALKAESTAELEQFRAAHGAEVALLRGGLADAEAACQASGLQNAALQAEMERRQQQGESDRAGMAQRLAAEAVARATVAEEIEDLRRQLAMARDETAAAQADMASLRAGLETSRAEAASLRARADEAARRTAAAVAGAREEIEALRRQLAAATAENQEARRETRKLTADRDALSRKSEGMAADLDSLQAKLADALATAAAAEPAAGSFKPAKKPRRSAVVSTADPAPAAAATPAAVMEAPPAPLQAAPATAGAAEPAGLNVRFRKPAGWAEPLYVHYWATDPAVAEPVWPGRPMTDAGDGWWAHRIDGARAASLIFDDNSGHQTGDLYRDRSGGLDHDGGWRDDRR